VSLPDLRTQLKTGSGTEGDDCGVLTILNITLWASRGRIGPKDQSEVASWVKRVRRWAKRPSGAMLVRGDCFEVYQHPEYLKLFKDAKITPPKATYNYKLPWGTLRDRLRAGQASHMAVNYGVLRYGDAPMGSATFNGGHSLALVGARLIAGKTWTYDGDPLFDGRRKGIPDGWKSAKLADFKAAAARFGSNPPGNDFATCITVKRGSR
jgi:hypothetical protein